MAATESTAVARQDKTTPTRRISWTDDSEPRYMQQNEKYLPVAASSNPFGDMHSTPAQQQSPPTMRHNDVEAQESFTTKLRHKHKGWACGVIMCMIVTWILLIVIVLFMTDNLFPTAARSYRAIMELKNHVIDMRTAVDMMRTQIGKMYGYIGGFEDLGPVDGTYDSF